MTELASKLAIGTAQFGMEYGIANKDGQVQQDEITAILYLARRNRIGTLDTAKAYGTSEKAIGSYLKNHEKSSWKIIIKISDFKNSLSQQLKDSIKKLSARPTALLAHSAELYLNEAFQAELQSVKEKNSITNTGVSLYNEHEINQVLGSDFKPDIIQLPMNILDTRLYRRGILSQLVEEGIEVHTRSAFLQGLFYLPEFELKNRFSDAIPYLGKLKSIAEAAGLTLSELSLLWLVSLEEVSKVVIGIDSANHLNSHLKSLEKKVTPACFEKALSIHYENDNILNPSNW